MINDNHEVDALRGTRPCMVPPLARGSGQPDVTTYLRLVGMGPATNWSGPAVLVAPAP